MAFTRLQGTRQPALLLGTALIACLAAGCGDQGHQGSASNMSATSPVSSDWPSNSAGQLAERLIALLESGHTDRDTTTLADFYRDNSSDAMRQAFPVDEQVSWLMQLRDDTGPLSLVTVTNSTEGSFEGILRTGTGAIFVRFTLVSSNGMIEGLLFEPVDSSEVLPADETPASLEAILEGIQRNVDVPGVAAAVYRGGILVESAAVGIQEFGSTRPVHVDDDFHVGSITKSMTAAVLAALVHDGVLSFDSTVGEINPSLGATENYESLTIRELIQHVAGLPAMTAPGDEIDRAMSHITGAPAEQREEFSRILVNSDAWFGERGRFEYSNAGYALAAHLAEYASGTSWEDLMRKYVFTPAGMDTAGFGWPASPDTPSRVRGHIELNGSLQPLPFGQYKLEGFMAPAGDVRCSVLDLAKWGQVQLTGFAGDSPPFDLEMISELHTAHYDPTYAFGWSLSPRPGKSALVWHNGSAGTFYAHLQIDRDSDVVVAIVCNSGPATQPHVERAAQQIVSLILE